MRTMVQLWPTEMDQSVQKCKWGGAPKSLSSMTSQIWHSREEVQSRSLEEAVARGREEILHELLRL